MEANDAFVTWCEDCDHRHPDAKPDEPWKWRCLRAPARPGYGFVSRHYSPSPPYSRCSDVNKYGECEDFESRRVAPEKAA